jgi:hypothetical protein
MQRLQLWLLVLALVAVAQANFVFDCYYNRERCFEEDIAYDTLVTGKYQAGESSVSTIHLFV